MHFELESKKRESEAWQNLFKSLDKEVEKVEVEKDTREAWHLAHPYPMPPNFTGRSAEQQMLDSWLADDKDRLFILRALGGFGKSALAWQWMNTHVNPAEWRKLVWWSFYEGDASFEHFIEDTLKYLKLEVPQGQRPQVDELLKAMQGGKMLLIMDGFERALRAYSSMNAAYQGDEEPKLEDNQLDCVNINAEIFLRGVCSLPNIKSKVLMTTRLTPRAIKPRGEFMLGCREEELTAMQKADAIEFFHKQKIKGTHAEIEAACAPYGYHPLSLRLLAGRILKDFENPADIVVAQKLKIDGDIIQQKHHVLEVSYNSLLPHEQKLLSTIACFRSPVELKTLQSIIETKNSLNNDLHDLIERGLLHFDEKNKKFDLHPIVRRYAYERLTVPDRTTAHIRLRDYFAAIDIPIRPNVLEDVAPIIELYHHLVETDELDKAYEIYSSIPSPLFEQRGAYQLVINLLSALFLDGENNLPRVRDERDQDNILNDIALSYTLSGNPQVAIQLSEMQIAIRTKRGDKRKLVDALMNAALQELVIGSLRSAEEKLHTCINLCLWNMVAEEWGTYHFHPDFYLSEGNVHLELGGLLVYCGLWDEANIELQKSSKLFKYLAFLRGQYIVMMYFALRSMLLARFDVSSRVKNSDLAIQYSQNAFELVKKFTQEKHSIERDYIHVHWLLGKGYCMISNFSLAEDHLDESLHRCRAIQLISKESDILLDLARLRYDQKNYEEARSLAEEALTITERCGYVLQGADVNLFLAQYTLEQDKDKAKAKEYAETALKLATCDGPPYYYKVAYDEAERMLVGL